MLLFALFLELLGWFILTGLFTTFCKYTLCFLYLMATHMVEVMYILLIIHPTSDSVKNLKGPTSLSIRSANASLFSRFGVGSCCASLTTPCHAGNHPELFI